MSMRDMDLESTLTEIDGSTDLFLLSWEYRRTLGEILGIRTCLENGPDNMRVIDDHTNHLLSKPRLLIAISKVE